MDKMGEKIFDTRLSIADDPRLIDAMTHHEFDSEGMAQEKLNLIQNGVYKNVFHNSKRQ